MTAYPARRLLGCEPARSDGAEVRAAISGVLAIVRRLARRNARHQNRATALLFSRPKLAACTGAEASTSAAAKVLDHLFHPATTPRTGVLSTTLAAGDTHPGNWDWFAYRIKSLRFSSVYRQDGIQFRQRQNASGSLACLSQRR